MFTRLGYKFFPQTWVRARREDPGEGGFASGLLLALSGWKMRVGEGIREAGGFRWERWLKWGDGEVFGCDVGLDWGNQMTVLYCALGLVVGG